MSQRVQILLTLFIVALFAPTGQSQSAPAEEIQKAQSLFQSKDYEGTIRTLEEYFRRNPSATGGWLLLSNAYREQKVFDKAMTSALKAAQTRATRPQGLFNAAQLCGLKGDRAEALKLLEELRDTGNIDMDQVRASGDLKSLAGDPAFESLFPKPADFKNPFVEKATIVHEWSGETKGDQFSWIARRIGDVDGDMVQDFVTSAPTFGAAGRQFGPGRVYAYSGKDGRLLWTVTGQTENESLGTGLEAAGDINLDGFPDVIAGAPGVDRAFVYSGRDGKKLLSLKAGKENELFGSSASGVGDQNGDGYADVLVGAPGGPSGQSVGHAFLFSGKDASLLRTFEGEASGDALGSVVAGEKNARGGFMLIGAPGRRGRVYVYRGSGPSPQFVIESDAQGVALGAMFASVVGDVNGDKIPDLYASDWSHAAKGPSTGRVYIHSGADGHRLYTFTGEAAGDGFGIGSADVGDVNQDGYADLLIGAWQYAGAAASGGKVYLYSGKDGVLLRTITCRIAGDTFGFDATGVGDVDGDGVIDFLLTSSWSGIRGFHSGRMFVISGRQAAGPCESGAQYKQFDFWLGDWEARAAANEKGGPLGQSRIEKISGGCVIQENWESPGFTGKSWNFFDVGLGKWRQIWIDVTGRKAEFTGGYREDAMRFEGETVRADGVRIKSRMTFFNLGPDKVRQFAERSTDGGQTWTTTVDYLYTRKK